ncbi:hypothetical protein E2C01_102568 [Portunus trituberculatus]|uniref:Uncharacterized protein n=1 Tax=Portunus trituberculatus TaxID=210409 RepID=A0A5B7KDN0_PORTR|nr:hypothetical protein [Portunus trituberculatus]
MNYTEKKNNKKIKLAQIVVRRKSSCHSPRTVSFSAGCC